MYAGLDPNFRSAHFPKCEIHRAENCLCDYLLDMDRRAEEDWLDAYGDAAGQVAANLNAIVLQVHAQCLRKRIREGSERWEQCMQQVYESWVNAGVPSGDIRSPDTDDIARFIRELLD